MFLHHVIVIRIIVRRDISPEVPKKKRILEETSRRNEERRMEEDDADLMEMRRKALESLMKKRDREIERGERKIIIPLGDDSSSDSDSSTTSKQESEVSYYKTSFKGSDQSKGSSKSKVNCTTIQSCRYWFR